MNSCQQIWIIRNRDKRRCCTIEDVGADPLEHVRTMLTHYETLLPDGSPYVADRYVLASTVPRTNLRDLFINHVGIPEDAIRIPASRQTPEPA